MRTTFERFFFDPKETVLGGLGRRLAWAAGGSAIVLAVGAVGPTWAGLVVLFVWFLPLLLDVARQQLMVLLAIAVMGLAGVSALTWKFVGFFVAILVEEFVVVLTVATLGASLL